MGSDFPERNQFLLKFKRKCRTFWVVLGFVPHLFNDSKSLVFVPVRLDRKPVCVGGDELLDHLDSAVHVVGGGQVHRRHQRTLNRSKVVNHFEHFVVKVDFLSPQLRQLVFHHFQFLFQRIYFFLERWFLPSTPFDFLLQLNRPRFFFLLLVVGVLQVVSKCFFAVFKLISQKVKVGRLDNGLP